MGDVNGCMGSCWDCPVFPACLHEDNGYRDEGESWRIVECDEIQEKGPGLQFDPVIRTIHKESSLESYIVRIYRLDRADEGEMLGTVEDMEAKGRHSFRSFDELREILCKKEQAREKGKHVEKADQG